MLSREETFDKLKIALAQNTKDQAEAIIISSNKSLTRYSNSVIHQNVHENETTLYLRTIKGKKIGTCITSDLTDEGIQKAMNKSSLICDAAEDNPDFITLPCNEKPIIKNQICEKTRNISPSDRAYWIKHFAKNADKFNISIAGSFITSINSISIMNTLGLENYFETTRARFVAMAIENENTGYAETASYSIDNLDIPRKCEIALKKCIDSRNPVEITPGKYKVFLEKKALSDLIRMFTLTQFGSLAKQEGRSIMSENTGKKIVSDKISIYDDGNASDSLILPFDFEGIPKQKVMFIEKGVTKDVVYDSLTSVKDGKKSTGHSLPPGNEGGPLPLNVFLMGNNKSEKSILEEIDSGLLITRFHYLNPFLNPKTALFTGTTRDGTFLIKNGKKDKPVKNLRFTQSMLEAFNSVIEISRETEIFNEGFLFTCKVPSMTIDNFNFTGNL
jgi:PmbA protein